MLSLSEGPKKLCGLGKFLHRISQELDLNAHQSKHNVISQKSLLLLFIKGEPREIITF